MKEQDIEEMKKLFYADRLTAYGKRKLIEYYEQRIKQLEEENAELKIQRDYYKREYSLYNKTLEEAGKSLTKK